MKIGVSAIGYECEEHLHKVIAPWNNHKINAEVHISVSHGVFPETAKLGFPIKSTDGTLVELNKYYMAGIVGKVTVTEQPTFEKDLRNLTLPYLFDKKVDLLWLLDLQDEIYTVDQINAIIKYVEENPFNTWFKINFKNYVFDYNTYVNDFTAPRVWRTDRCGGIKEFYYDNEIVYNNGVAANDLPNELVPRDVAFVKHLSWVGSPEYLKRKINFQKIHYGDCSYAWDEQANKLIFNEEYFKKFNKEKPNTFKD